MQFTPLDALYAGLPGLAIGFLAGYILGASRSLSTKDRFFIALAVGLFGGVIIAFLLLTGGIIVVDPEGNPSMTVLLSIMSTFGGIGVGAVMHWQPFAPTPPKRHVTFDPEEDDEEFDRQLREGLGG